MRRICPLLALSLSVSSCLPVEDNKDGQIVVIGNGAEMTTTIVVDVAGDEGRQTLILSGHELIPALSSIDKDLKDPVHVNWMAGNKEGREIFRIQSHGRSSSSCVYVEAQGGKRAQCSQDLQAFPLSVHEEPTLLKGGALLFRDDQGMLWYADNRQNLVLVSEGKMDQFLVDELENVLVMSDKTWKWISHDSLKSHKPKAEHWASGDELVYRSDGGRIYALSHQEGFRLWDANNKKFTQSWKWPEKIGNLAFEMGSAKHFGEGLFLWAKNNFVILDPLYGLTVIPLVRAPGVFFDVGKKGVWIRRPIGDQFCSRDENQKWTCSPLILLPLGEVTSLEVTDGGDIFILAKGQDGQAIGEIWDPVKQYRVSSFPVDPSLEPIGTRSFRYEKLKSPNESDAP